MVPRRITRSMASLEQPKQDEKSDDPKPSTSVNSKNSKPKKLRSAIDPALLKLKKNVVNTFKALKTSSDEEEKNDSSVELAKSANDDDIVYPDPPILEFMPPEPILAGSPARITKRRLNIPVSVGPYVNRQGKILGLKRYKQILFSSDTDSDEDVLAMKQRAFLARRNYMKKLRAAAAKRWKKPVKLDFNEDTNLPPFEGEMKNASRISAESQLGQLDGPQGHDDSLPANGRNSSVTATNGGATISDVELREKGYKVDKLPPLITPFE